MANTANVILDAITQCCYIHCFIVVMYSCHGYWRMIHDVRTAHGHDLLWTKLLHRPSVVVSEEGRS